jgi:hypothetical protein
MLSTSPIFAFMLMCNTLLMVITCAYFIILYPTIYGDETLKDFPKQTERILFVVLPLIATSILTWGAITGFGIQNGPYWMLLLSIISYLLFGLPQKSSFVKLKSEPEEARPITSSDDRDPHEIRRESEMIGGVKYSELICDEQLSYFSTLQLFLPLGLHIATFWRSLLFGIPTTIGEWMHVTDIFIMTLVPLLLIGILGTIGRYSPLWWARGSKHEIVYKLALLASIFVLIPCLEFRVIYFAFNHLVNGLSAPYNYVALTFAFYSFALSITLHLRSGSPSKSSMGSGHGSATGSFTTFNALVASQMLATRKVSYFLAVFCAINFSLALGIPVYLWPAPIIASIAFISFYFERQWWMYVVFVGGLELGLIWFVKKTFLSLNFTFFTLAGYISIQVACVVIVALAAIASIITGLIVLGIFEKATNFLLILQASLVALMEEVLHMEQLTNDLDIYPAYLVVLTTVFGVLMARKLKNDGRINTNVLFVISMIYLSKLALLMKPVSWPTISAMLLLTPPTYLIFKLWDAQNVLVDASKSNTICMVYVGWLFFATIFNRWTLFQRLLELLAGEIHDHARPALVHGISFVFFGTLLPPLAWHHPLRSENTQGNEFSQKRRRVISFSGFALIAVGFAAMASQQLFGSSASQQMLGTGVMSTVLGTRSGLPVISSLALIALLLIAGLIFTGTIDVMHSARQRIVTCMALGLAVGAFVSPFAISTSIAAVHSDPDEPSPVFITLGICFTFQLVAVIIAFADWHTLGARAKWVSFAPKMGPAAYVLMWLQWPLLFLGVLLLSLVTGTWRRDEMESYNVALIALQAFAQGIVALCLKVLEPENPDGPRTVASWISDVGNIATISCFGLALLVNYAIGGGDTTCLILAPILLLVQRAGSFKSFIPKRNPYFLVYVAASVSLISSGQSKLWLRGPLGFITQLLSVTLGDAGFGYEFNDWLPFTMEMIAQAVVIPGTVVLALFLWDLRPPNFGLLAIATFFTIAAVYLTEVPAVVALGILNVVCGLGAMLYAWIMSAPESSRPLERT